MYSTYQLYWHTALICADIAGVLRPSPTIAIRSMPRAMHQKTCDNCVVFSSMARIKHRNWIRIARIRRFILAIEIGNADTAMIRSASIQHHEHHAHHAHQEAWGPWRCTDLVSSRHLTTVQSTNVVWCPARVHQRVRSNWIQIDLNWLIAKFKLNSNWIQIKIDANGSINVQSTAVRLTKLMWFRFHAPSTIVARHHEFGATCWDMKYDIRNISFVDCLPTH